jgi:hypothetical protein
MKNCEKGIFVVAHCNFEVERRLVGVLPWQYSQARGWVLRSDTNTKRTQMN